ncbi:hypothetical protein KNP414_02652 [Paenibacillus mucilaginosus KNP414]|uniref:Uncharacterized protein n=1 Tax=Paenibacillus mucilaginosus (strain KNP414) TaxID=1036673 RepID=F8F5P0_PAEMK|nr:hypothetical protein KNP414_02652 [Paenibacillus mucilaginosus KNP414]
MRTLWNAGEEARALWQAHHQALQRVSLVLPQERMQRLK